MCGRLQVGKENLHVAGLGRCSHVFGLLSAVRMTAGHNTLRGSGPGQNPAFDHALALVGCPDRRIDRLCITCCSPSNRRRKRNSKRHSMMSQSCQNPTHAAQQFRWDENSSCLPQYPDERPPFGDAEGQRFWE